MIKRFRAWKEGLRKNPWVEWARSISMPGFEGVPVFDVFAFFFREIQKEDITLRASALAFNFFLAFFPALLFLFTLIPYIPIENLQSYVLTYLNQMLPDAAFQTVQTTVRDVLSQQRGGLLSFSLLFALYFAMYGVSTMLSAFRKSYPSFKQRNFIQQQLMALFITLSFSVLIIAAIILIIKGQAFLTWLMQFFNIEAELVFIGLTAVRWGIIVGLLFVALSFLYTIGPATRERWNFVSPGSTLATILIIVTSIGFSYYVNNFGRYNKLYGSIGAIIALMLWLYINALVILIGFELNTGIKVTKNVKAIGKEKDGE